ncbi:hypothetical protein [Nonomuraea salmonea]|uniref:hypothetical protein n=1 Tax=Nonomuraea salmonea TaxID=46181 RepID=UPI0031EBF918
MFFAVWPVSAGFFFVGLADGAAGKLTYAIADSSEPIDPPLPSPPERRDREPHLLSRHLRRDRQLRPARGAGARAVNGHPPAETGLRAGHLVRPQVRLGPLSPGHEELLGAPACRPAHPPALARACAG